MLLLLSFASQGFTDLSVEAQKKRLMGQIVAAEDPIIREKLRAFHRHKRYSLVKISINASVPVREEDPKLESEINSQGDENFRWNNK